MRLALFCLAAAAARVTSDAPDVARCACCELGDDVDASRLLTSKSLDDASIRTAVQLWFTDHGTYFFLSTWQFCARIGVGNRVGGTRCALNANAGQQDSQITGTVNHEPMKCLRLVSYRTLSVVLGRSVRYHSPST